MLKKSVFFNEYLIIDNGYNTKSLAANKAHASKAILKAKCEDVEAVYK